MVNLCEIGAVLPSVVVDLVDPVVGEREHLEGVHAVEPALVDAGDAVAVQPDLPHARHAEEGARREELDLVALEIQNLEGKVILWLSSVCIKT